MSKGSKKARGTLFIVATPIGNFDDITLRAIATLKEADIVLSEDTRSARKLLSHHGIRKRPVSFHSYSESFKSDDVIEDLKAGKDVALVSESGTPGISDPGSLLVRKAHREGIPVRPIPGPSAIAAALSVSGAPSSQIFFQGFLPRIKSRRIRSLLRIKKLNIATVIYESPKRVVKTIRDIDNFITGCDFLVGREMTKTYEEFLFGSAERILSLLEGREPKGEFTIVVIPSEKQKGADPVRIARRAKEIVEKFALSTKDSAKLLASEFSIPRKEAYRAITNLKDEGWGCEDE